jgi:hypothetical protein
MVPACQSAPTSEEPRSQPRLIANKLIATRMLGRFS